MSTSEGQQQQVIAKQGQIYTVSDAAKQVIATWLAAEGDVIPRITVTAKNVVNLKDRRGAVRSFVSEGEESPAIAQIAQHCADLRRDNSPLMTGTKGGPIFSHVRYIATNEHSNRHFIVSEKVFEGITKSRGTKNEVQGKLEDVPAPTLTTAQKLEAAQAKLAKLEEDAKQQQQVIADLQKQLKQEAREAKLQQLEKEEEERIRKEARAAALKRLEEEEAKAAAAAEEAKQEEEAKQAA